MGDASETLLPDHLTATTGTGEVVELRHWELDDAEAMGEAIAASIDELRPWMAWIAEEPKPIEDRRKLIASWERTWRDGGDSVFGAFVDGEVVGSAGLHRRIGRGGLEIGYWVHSDHTGRGLATAMAGRLTETALAHPGIARVEIHCDRANRPSNRVAAKVGCELVSEARHPLTAPGEAGVECIWRFPAGG